MKSKNLSDIPKMWAGQLQDYTVGHDVGTGSKDLNVPGQARSQLDTNMAFWAGMKSMPEKETAVTNAILAKEKLAAEFNIKHAVSLIKEVNFPTDKKMQLIQDMAIQYSVDPDKLIDDLTKAQEDNRMTDEQRRAIGEMNTTEALHWYMEWMKLKKEQTVKQ